MHPRLSILLPLDTSLSTLTAGAKRVEHAGLAGVWVPDHLSGGTFFPRGQWMDAFVALGAIRASCPTIRIGPLVASALLRPAATLRAALVSLEREGPVAAGIGTGAERDAMLLGCERPNADALLAYAKVIREGGLDVILAANVPSTVKAARALGGSWVTTGGFKRTGEEKGDAVKRLRSIWDEAPGKGGMYVLIDPHEPSPWKSEHHFMEIMTYWGAMGCCEVVVWPPSVFPGKQELTIKRAGELLAQQ